MIRLEREKEKNLERISKEIVNQQIQENEQMTGWMIKHYFNVLCLYDHLGYDIFEYIERKGNQPF